MAEIIKKCDKTMFGKILAGDKTFEVRLADENYNGGDILLLKEVDESHNFTGREIKKQITFVLKTKDLEYWDQKDINKHGFAVMGLK